MAELNWEAFRARCDLRRAVVAQDRVIRFEPEKLGLVFFSEGNLCFLCNSHTNSQNNEMLAISESDIYKLFISEKLTVFYQDTEHSFMILIDKNDERFEIQNLNSFDNYQKWIIYYDQIHKFVT